MFKAEDLSLIKGLKKILDDATFPLKKREVAAFAMVIKWVDELEKKIENDLKEKPIEKKKSKADKK